MTATSCPRCGEDDPQPIQPHCPSPRCDLFRCGSCGGVYERRTGRWFRYDPATKGYAYGQAAA